MKSLLLIIAFSWFIVGQINAQDVDNFATDCEYAKLEETSSDGKVKKILKRETLIRFTNERLRMHFQNSDFFKLEAYLASFGDEITFYAKIRIKTTTPEYVFGELREGSDFEFILDNGDVVSLKCGKQDQGNVNYRFGQTIYFTYYEVSEEDLALLESSRIDYARIHWSTEVMEYPVTNDEFFLKQLSCLR